MIITLLLLSFLLIWGIINFKSVVNPLSLFCGGYIISVLAVFFSDSLGLLRLMAIEDIQPFCSLINIAVLSFSIPWMLVKTNKISFLPSTQIIEYLRFENIIFFLAVFSSLLLFFISILIGGLPMILMWQGKMDVNTYNDLLDSMPFGILALILNFGIIYLLFVTSFLINRNYYNFNTKLIVFYIVIIILVCFWQSKRQLLLLFIFIYAARSYLNSNNLIKNKYINFNFLYLFGLLYLFYLSFNIVSSLRQNTDTVNKNELLEYAMYPAMNMVKIVDTFPFYSKGLTFPNYILTEILPRRLIGEDIIDFRTILFEPTSPSGYLAYWYMDYGCYGVIMGCIILSLFSIYIYKNSMKSEINLRIYLLILWCCATSSIYSHFISLNFFIIPYILLSLSKYFFRIEKRSKTIDI